MIIKQVKWATRCITYLIIKLHLSYVFYIIIIYIEFWLSYVVECLNFDKRRS